LLSSNLKPQQRPFENPFMPFIGCIIQPDKVDACRIETKRKILLALGLKISDKNKVFH
jgi:hypothetical protein